MSRKLERVLLMVGAAWNIITALLTIFGYSSWFENTGINTLRYTEVTPMEASVLIKNISTVVLVFGLGMFVGGIITLIVARNIKNNIIQNNILIWVGIWGIVQFLAGDAIGFCLFSIVFVIYLAKNKAIKLSQNLTAREL